MDWDKLRIFHAAAEAGSFTHAGQILGLSQSAVSRQVSALEQDLNAILFQRHARGLILTEQGELLYRTAHDVFIKLETVKGRLADFREKPSGLLRVTTTIGLGSAWLTSRLKTFMELYPAIQLQLILADDELDISKREADVAIRLRKPTQPDMVQRRLFTVHFHVFASQDYLKQFGEPKSIADLDNHRILTFGTPTPQYLKDVNWLEIAGRPADNPRLPALRINGILGLLNAVERGMGLALLPDYLIEPESELIAVLPEADVPSFESYFVYPEDQRRSARVAAFRDFLVANARRWEF